MSRLSLLLLVSLACVAVASASPFIRRDHVGALNHRLSREQLSQRSLGDIVPQWLTQKLDHQDLTSTVTWQQKYYVNDTWYQPGGPVFYVLGGEGNNTYRQPQATPRALNSFTDFSSHYFLSISFVCVRSCFSSLRDRSLLHCHFGRSSQRSPRRNGAPFLRRIDPAQRLIH